MGFQQEKNYKLLHVSSLKNLQYLFLWDFNTTDSPLFCLFYSLLLKNKDFWINFHWEFHKPVNRFVACVGVFASLEKKFTDIVVQPRSLEKNKKSMESEINQSYLC